MAQDAQEIVDLLESIWASIDEVCSDLSAEEWTLATECPGWTVKDQLAHIIGTESMLAGKPPPQHKVEPKPYVKNRIGELNEVYVDARRPLPAEEVLKEFRSITKERLAALRKMTPAEFERQTMTPVGPDSYLEFMKIRAFDCWVHEQDIRRAVGRPGNLTGKAARHAVMRCFMAMPYVVGKKAAFPEGSSASFTISYPDQSQPDTLTVGVREGRGVALDPSSESGELCVELRSDVGTYVALCSGRIDHRKALETSSLKVVGDSELSERLLANLGFMI